MEPLFEHRLELGGYGTRALELEGEGPPLLLIHGYGDSADTWRRMLVELARAKRRAVAVDLPGFGEADRLRRGEPIVPQLEAFAADAVRRLADEHGKPVYVAGNSLGGLTALRLAMREDDLPLAGVIPIGPAGFDHPVWFTLIRTQPAIRFLLASPVPVPQRALRVMLGQVYRQLAFAHGRQMSADVVDAFTGHYSSQRDMRRLLGIGSTMMPEIAGGRAFDLAKINVPVTLIWGDRDRMVSHKGARHLVEALPGMRYELLAGVGHCPQIEVPERVTEIVREVAPAVPMAA
jgi:pimeloyl-ACP methyl ester carboxylesterase